MLVGRTAAVYVSRIEMSISTAAALLHLTRSGVKNVMVSYTMAVCMEKYGMGKNARTPGTEKPRVMLNQPEIMKEKPMKKRWNYSRLLVVLLFAGLLSACAAGPYGPTFGPPGPPQPPPQPQMFFNNIAPNDHYYSMQVDDRTPFGLFSLPQTRNTLYNKGYDEVRRQNQADFSINIAFTPGMEDNPDQRAANTLGGALGGAALGAIIGGATGSPGTGAAIGAASGGALGLVAPASSPLIRIDMNVYDFNTRESSSGGVTLDISRIPPHQVPGYVDNEVSRMLQALPAK